jgi:hypothetical protein
MNKLQVQPEVVIDGFTAIVVTIGSMVQILYNDPTVSVIVAGMAGGAVRWYSEKEKWRTGIGSIFIGGICARYLGPFGMNMLEGMSGVTISDEANTTGAFITGLTGILLIKYIMDKFKYTTDQASIDFEKLRKSRNKEIK